MAGFGMADLATPQLLLFTRQGCCLCDGLEEKLAALVPAPAITRIDVDRDPALQARYGLEVPVLAVAKGSAEWQELPRVPPRLSGDGLAVWLHKNGFDGQQA
jgi:hypothetical protein